MNEPWWPSGLRVQCSHKYQITQIDVGSNPVTVTVSLSACYGNTVTVTVSLSAYDGITVTVSLSTYDDESSNLYPYLQWVRIWRLP